MKKYLFIALLLIIIFICGIITTPKKIDSNHKYSQEYIIGESNIKGEVNIEYFISKSKNFEIGANKYGYAVFKNPNSALKTLKNKYKKGIRIIQKQYKFLPLSKFNYDKYKTYGWQVTIGTEEEREQARFVSTFFDIYENSYK